MESWARCPRGRIFFRFRAKSCVLSIFFSIYFGIAYIWPVYHSLDKKIWFKIIFLPLKESGSIPDMFFYYSFTYFTSVEVIEDRTTKINSKYFNGKMWPFQFVLVDQFYFYILQSIRLCFWKDYPWARCLFIWKRL